jgi:GNAT superfamily N-acetyltransferase
LRTRISEKNDVPQLKALWKQAFGDEERFIDAFFEDLYREERCAVIEDGGRIISMAYLLPCSLDSRVDASGAPLQGGGIERLRCVYLYGMATDEAQRGKGLGLMLLSFVKGYAGALGCEGIATLPADDKLFGFYKKAGYIEYFEPQPLFDAPCRLSYPQDVIDFQRKIDAMYGQNSFAKSPMEVSGYRAMLRPLSGRIPDVKAHMAIALE